MSRKWKKLALGDKLSYQIVTEPNGKKRAANIHNMDIAITETGTGKAVIFAAIYLGAVCIAIWLGKLPYIVLEAYVFMGLITLIYYRLDKWFANTNRRRVPENTLHLLSLAFGWLGAAIAQQWFRHKTIKQEFRFTYYATAIVNSLLVAFLMHPRGEGLNATLTELTALLHAFVFN